MKVVTVKEMKQLERAADAGGHSYAEMMERAGRSVAQAVQSYASVQDAEVLVLVGPGNNGGDGLVAARYLKQAGARVVCYLVRARDAEDPNWTAVRQLGVPCTFADQDTDTSGLRDLATRAQIIIDALLGTGIARPITGPLERLLRTVRDVVHAHRTQAEPRWQHLQLSSRRAPRNRPPLVVAVDVPSGLNCDTGAVDPATLPADLTITFAAVKRGQLALPGFETLGELIVADIGIDPALTSELSTEVVTAEMARRLLPPRPLDAHKGTFGKAMIVAGSINYPGAPYLAAAAAARSGAGLITLAPPQPLYNLLATRLTEATFVLLPHDLGVLVPAAIKVLAEHLSGYRVLLLGPGLGQDSKTVEFVHKLLGISSGVESRRLGFRHADQPVPEKLELPRLVVDADGLNALAQVREWWTHLPENSVLTPHPGEMARLTSQDIRHADRIELARAQAQAWRQVVVLKGAFTVVAAPDGRAAIVPFATPALATAGTGDVLAGTIAGLLAQGTEPYDAAACGAYLHGQAAVLAAEEMGVHPSHASGVLAGDLLRNLPRAIEQVKTITF